MNLVALILYGAVNAAMVLYCMRSRESFYHYPFWAGVISLGWFLPQAIGAYVNVEQFPDYAYADGVLFAAICSGAMWFGYVLGFHKSQTRPTWLDARFNLDRLFWACAALCLFGFYFQWKLSALPDELKSETQWSGVTVKYWFLSSVFRFGFISLWLIYLNQRKFWVPKMLVLLVPALLLLFKSAVLDGRREGMMDLLAYIVIGLWFARSIAIPRWLMISGLAFGLVLINAIGVYRSIMFDSDMTWSERMVEAANADYSGAADGGLEKSGFEFKNYIYHRFIYDQTSRYDWGLVHWNKLVFNYVPAQIVGRELKESLMLPMMDVNKVAKLDYAFSYHRGSTSTGYKDSFGSFGWFGFIKFMAIGWMMGVLYRHASQGSLLGQMLYIVMLATAMLSVTHTTHRILFADWVYFFSLGYPAFLWAKSKRAPTPVSASPMQVTPWENG